MSSVQGSDAILLDDIFEAIESEDVKTCFSLISTIQDINSLHPDLCIGIIHAATAIPCTSFARTLFRNLIKWEIDVNLATGEGYTPLDIAVANDRIQTTKFLLKHGAVASERTLNLAQEFNNATCEKLIKEVLTSSVSGYDTDALVVELKKLGLNPGPITKTTKPLYIRYRDRHKLKDGVILSSIAKDRKQYSPELELVLSKDSPQWDSNILKHENLEEQFTQFFDSKFPHQPKLCFTYLLLNSQVTKNLPKLKLKPIELFNIFINSIFYIGKGTDARPYAHLHEAKTCIEKNLRVKNEKTRKIVSLWRDGFGVVCLTAFRNVTSDEALSREAAMISAIGLDNLTNEIQSNFFKDLKWTGKQKAQLGCFLLFQCFKIHMREGERPLMPENIR